MARSFISTSSLAAEPYSGIIGYPRATPRQTRLRVSELEKLGISSVMFAGPTSIGRLDVLGKGYVGVVVLAKRKAKKVALKIRRTDSQRSSMKPEAKLLKLVNSVNVGPKFYDASKNCLVMEYVKGDKIGDWVGTVGGRGAAKRAKSVIRGVLEDCYRLDRAGIDHGELSSISKHIIVGESRQVMIDFESSSTQRRASNVTSAAQAIFIGSGIAKKIRRIYRIPPRQQIIDSLRRYKRQESRQSFEELLDVLKLGRV